MFALPHRPGANAIGQCFPAAAEGEARALPVPDLCPSFGEVASRMSQHIDANAKFYPGDNDRGAVFESDAELALDTSTAGSHRHQSSQLNVGRKLLRLARARTAAFRLVLHARDVHVVLRGICADVQQAGGRLITFSEAVRYDETPLQLSVVDDQLLQDFPESFAAARESLAAIDELKSLVGTRHYDTGPTKILQTQRSFSLLVSVGDRFFCFSIAAVMPVLSMERTTANCYFDCLQLLDSLHQVEGVASQFERRQRLSCTDGDGAIDRAERARLGEASASTLRTLCNLHKRKTDKVKACSLATTVVTQLTHAVLSLNINAGMRTFRAAVKDCLLENLIVSRQRPSAEVSAGNERILQSALPDQQAN